MIIAIIRSGPTLCIYRDGGLMLEIPLSVTKAFNLALDLFTEAMRARKDGE